MLDILNNSRTQEAWRLQSQVEDGQGARAIDELLAEVWLRRRGVNHMGRVNVGGVVADLLIARGPNEWVCWRLHDLNPVGKVLLKGKRVGGAVIAEVIDINPADIMAGDLCMEQAFYGVAMR